MTNNTASAETITFGDLKPGHHIFRARPDFPEGTVWVIVTAKPAGTPGWVRYTYTLPAKPEAGILRGVAEASVELVRVVA